MYSIPDLYWLKMSIPFGHIMPFLNSKMWWGLLIILIHVIHECVQLFLSSRGCVSLHISVWIISFAPWFRLFFENQSLKNNHLSIAVMWKSIVNLEWSSAYVCLIPTIDQVLVFSKFSPLCALLIFNAALITATISFIHFPYFRHLIIWASSSSVFFLFFSFFSYCSQISQFFHQIDVACIKDIFWIAKLILQYVCGT